MGSHLKYLIAGGVIAGEGGSLALLGWMFNMLGYIQGRPLPPATYWSLMIAGVVSLIIGGVLLIIGYSKYKNRGW
ncbi:MAG: hypothetical protein HWN65_19005 [Candidatus Helarchaeota archaeon]|nr:hypothetical protein [Candidatus Helarchaeota archaeon]